MKDKPGCLHADTAAWAVNLGENKHHFQSP